MKKSKSRRRFIKKSVTAGIALPLLNNSLFSCVSKGENESEAAILPLKILILGGTSFLGPHQIAYALKRGHSISTFTRGKTEPTVILSNILMYAM